MLSRSMLAVIFVAGLVFVASAQQPAAPQGQPPAPRAGQPPFGAGQPPFGGPGQGGFGPPAAAQPDGAATFKRACASCHASNQAGVPTMQTLQAMTPEAVVTALASGKMSVQGAGLSAAEHRAIAQYLTGRAPAPTTTSATANRCKTPAPTTDPARAASWMGWSGNDATNARYVPKGGISAADLPKLKLKWAFGYEAATAARVQPALAGGKLFVASDNTELLALDAKTGCTYWVYKAQSGARSPLTVGPYKTSTGSGYAVVFGDQIATVYAVDTITGREIWKRKVDNHAAAAITGAITIDNGKAFVPVQGLNEEGTGGRGNTPCCTFRGSLSSLDMNTGEVLWKTYFVDEPTVRGKNSRSGADALGPAGGSVWGAPTVDPKRQVVYVATGNNYADPPQKMTDAVVALDIKTGAVKWVNQVTANDTWLGGCGARGGGNPGCPETLGPDFDFSAAPMLVTSGNRQLIVVPQKSGLAYALDPDKNGALVWQYRFGQGSGLGGVWGASSDGTNAYFGVGDGQSQNPGGVRAAKLSTGEQVWSANPPQPRLCASTQRCNASQGAATTVIPGAVLAGSLDGGLRAYSTEDGKVLWEFDTNKSFETVNGVKAQGASIDGSPLIIVDGLMYVNSGYGGIAARPGNVLLVFGVD